MRDDRNPADFEISGGGAGFVVGRWTVCLTWSGHTFLFGVMAPPGSVHVCFGPFGLLVARRAA